MALTVDERSFTALEANLNRQERVADTPTLRRAVQAGQDVVYDVARRLVPVDTGQLRSSIEKRPPGVSKKGDYVYASVVAGRSGLGARAVVIEYGWEDTHRTRSYGPFERGPQAYFAPALVESGAAAFARTSAVVANNLQKMVNGQ